uniref:Si:dkey-83h2.3 n=1 Tax=Sinocyclocheilus anshuiensis TaxID=1608454 RepID=A0A671S804_9TELE
MCTGHCSRSVGMALIPTAIVCMLANALLLFPDLKYQYLTENHVTREAMWCSGIWASGLLVIFLWFFQVLRKLGYACLVILAAGLCFVVSGTGLALGPLCLHNSTDEKLYLYAPERWPSACVEPRGVVIWNMVLFSVLMVASGLELVFCVLHLLTALLEFMCGPKFCKNKVEMFTKSLPSVLTSITFKVNIF